MPLPDHGAFDFFTFTAPPIFHDTLASQAMTSVAMMRSSVARLAQLERTVDGVVHYASQFSTNAHTIEAALAGYGEGVGNALDGAGRGIEHILLGVTHGTKDLADGLVTGPITAITNGLMVLLLAAAVLVVCLLLLYVFLSRCLHVQLTPVWPFIRRSKKWKNALKKKARKERRLQMVSRQWGGGEPTVCLPEDDEQVEEIELPPCASGNVRMVQMQTQREQLAILPVLAEEETSLEVLPKTEPKNEPEKSSKRSKRKMVKTYPDNDSTASDVSVVNVLNAKYRLGLKATTEVTIQGHSVTALLDTGAQSSFVSPSLMQRLGNGGIRLETSQVIKMTSVTGDKFTPEASFNANLQIGDRSAMVRFHIGKLALGDCIIGTDAMETLNLPMEFDFPARQLKLGGVVLPLGGGGTANSTEGQLCQLTVADTISIPPRTHTVFPAATKAKPGTYLSTSSLQSFLIMGLLPAAIVATVSNGSFPFRVWNPMRYPVTLYKGQRLGALEPFDNESILATLGVEEWGSNVEQQSKLASQNVTKHINVTEKNQTYTHLNQIHINEHLKTEEREKIQRLLVKFSTAFALNDDDMGRCSIGCHSIPTGNRGPVVQPMFRIPMAQRATIEKQTQDMVKRKLIQPSNSVWNSSILVVPKKDGSARYVIDTRALNSISDVSHFPMPRIDESLESLGGNQYFSCLDCYSGYWQIPMKREDVEKTAFMTPSGKYEYLVMPMGLTGSAATFQAVMTEVLRGLQGDCYHVYLDDIIVMSKTMDDHLKNLARVLERVTKYGIKLKPKKCHIACTEIKYLGHVVDRRGIRPDKEKLQAIERWGAPKNVAEVQSFLGLTGYFRSFVKNYATIAAPLNQLKQKSTPFVWTPEREVSFQTLKMALTSPRQILAYPDFTKTSRISTDASQQGIGAVLLQKHDNGKEQPIAYASRTLTKAEKNYSTYELECLAIVWAVTKKFRHYVYGQEFEIYTDHRPLIHLKTAKHENERVARWAQKLQDYRFAIYYREGKSNQVADALSRCGAVDSAVTPEVAPIHLVSVPDIVQKQSDDPKLAHIIHYLQTGIVPEDQTLPQDVEKLFCLRNGLLHRVFTDDNERTALVVPDQYKKTVLQFYHDDLCGGGHNGQTRTIKRIRQLYYWRGLRGDVEQWVAQCLKCAAGKAPRNRIRAPLVPLTPAGPLDIVASDVCGPFPVTEEGNRYVVTFIDLFTKYVECYATKDQTAETVARLFVEQFVCRHGVPNRYLSDQGPCYIANLTKEVCRLLRTEKIYCTPLHPETDGLCERWHHTMANILKMAVNDSHTDWDRLLPFAQLSYNSGYQNAIKTTPYQLVYGRTAQFSLDVSTGLTVPNSRYLDTITYSDHLQIVIAQMMTTTRDNLKTAAASSKAYYDRRVRASRLKEGDLVMVYSPQPRVGRCAKFENTYIGPYQIRRLTGVNAEVVLVDGLAKHQHRPRRFVHVNNIKPYGGRATEGHPVLATPQATDARPRATDDEPAANTSRAEPTACPGEGSTTNDTGEGGLYGEDKKKTNERYFLRSSVKRQ